MRETEPAKMPTATELAEGLSLSYEADPDPRFVRVVFRLAAIRGVLDSATLPDSAMGDEAPECMASFCRSFMEGVRISRDEPRDHMMTFAAAIHHLKSRGRVTRKGWNGDGMWLEMQVPDADSKMTRPYIYISTAPYGELVPWVASQSDILADDWLMLTRPC